jgi:hypothetical protein
MTSVRHFCHEPWTDEDQALSVSGFVLALNCFGWIDEVYPAHLRKRRHPMRLEMG